MENWGGFSQEDISFLDKCISLEFGHIFVCILSFCNGYAFFGRGIWGFNPWKKKKSGPLS